MFIAKAYFSERDFDLATTYIDKAIEGVQGFDNENFKFATYQLAGKIALENNQYNKADSIFSIALLHTYKNKEKARLYSYKHTTQTRLGNLDKGLNYLSEMHKYIGNDTISSLMAEYYFNLKIHYEEQRNTLKSLEYILKAKKIQEQIGEDLITVNRNISGIYYSLGAYEKCIDIQLELLEQFQKENKYKDELHTLYTIGDTYLELKEYDLTKKYAFKAIELRKKENVSDVFGFNYYLIGMSHLKQNQLDSANHYFQLGIDISLERQENKELADNYFGMSELRMLQGNTQEAKTYGEKGLAGINYVSFNTNDRLATIYAQERNYKAAYNRLRENWTERTKQDENRGNYEIISNLLSEKHEREKETVRLEKEAAQSTRNILGLGLITTLLLTLGWSITVHRNNKQRKRYNEELQAKNDELKTLDETKTRFFANISHEFKTPLTLILNPISRILKNKQLNEKDKFLAQSAEENSLQLLALTNQLLELTKFDVNKVENNPIVFNLAQTINKLYADFKSLAVSKKIRFEKDIQVHEDLNVLLDYNKFITIIKNLISNAIKFTNEEGEIKLKVIEKLNTLEVRIEDTGRGIHPSDLSHIFDRYYQAKITSSIQEGGTGIGLAICYEYSKLLGGSLNVQSEYGKGSNFIFMLPKTVVEKTALPNILLEQHPISKTVFLTPNPSKNEKPHTILIVEDNLDMQNYLRLILQDYYQIEIAPHGKSALKILKEKYKNIQLIISDVMMPEMNGYELLTHLKRNANYASIPTIMLTALSGTDYKLKALRTGIDDYLTKPFVDEELLIRIDNLLQNQEEKTAYRQYNENETTSNHLTKENLEWLENLENYINRNLSYPLTVLSIAEHLHTSKTNLYKQLKTLTGLTPSQYVNEIRYQTARNLIKEQSNWTIKAISLKVGFKDEKNFARNFKKRFGKYPSDFLE